MTSGGVKRELFRVMSDSNVSFTVVSMAEIKTCHDDFARLIEKRNALIHAHPITDGDGLQILNYQTDPRRALPDMKWPVSEVETAIQEFDDAACYANSLLHRLLA